MSNMEDIEIAHRTRLIKINNITKRLGIPNKYIENFGNYKAKISLDYFEKIKMKKNGKLILVTAINPTPLGEGKTTAAIGLADGLNLFFKKNKLDKKAILALREPSMGPVFGIKGGATGGGHSQVVPMEDINLHFTGDMHALTSANNLLSSIIDNHIYFGNELHFQKVTWRRCLDLNDRELRKVTVGLSGEKKMIPRDDNFDITVATEMMAILCLSTDIKDLQRRIGNIIVGINENGNPIYCRDLKVDGALAVLLKDAINPNIVQTLEKTPAIIHGGPFANIAHGCNSIIATKYALKLGDYTVTEAGFGADLGAEKFLDIKTRKLGEYPDCVVIVATLRALKYHGGSSKLDCSNKNVETLKIGIKNLLKHIDNIKNFGLNPIVAINKFSQDTKEEINILETELRGKCDYSLLENWQKGGKGSQDIAKKVIDICNKEKNINYTYDLKDSIKEKIKKVSLKIYGARNVIFTEETEKQIREIEKLLKENKSGGLPICIAKTQYSLSDDEKNLLVDEPFDIHVREVELKNGAEFIIVKTGKILTMPGLPKVPSAENIKINDNGEIEGIF